MRWLIAAVSIVILFVFQLALADLNFLDSAPNLVLVYLCLALAYWRLGDTLIMAVGAGVLLDFFSALPDGVMLVGLVLAMLVSEYLIRALFTAGLGELLPLVQVVLASIAFFVVIMLTNQIFVFTTAGLVLDWNYLLTHKLGADVILNILAIYPVHLYYRLQDKVQARMGYKLTAKNEPI